MDLQLHASLEHMDLDPENFEPAMNNHDSNLKPLGGLWTSTYVKEKGSDYVQRGLLDFHPWIRKMGIYSWILKPAKDARICFIETAHDAHAFLRKYPRKVDGGGFREIYIDFEAAAEDLDAIYLTCKGVNEAKSIGSQDTCNEKVLYPGFLGWQSEACIWLNWAIAEVKDLGEVKWNV